MPIGKHNNAKRLSIELVPYTVVKYTYIGNFDSNQIKSDQKSPYAIL